MDDGPLATDDSPSLCKSTNFFSIFYAGNEVIVNLLSGSHDNYLA